MRPWEGVWIGHGELALEGMITYVGVDKHTAQKLPIIQRVPGCREVVTRDVYI